MKIYTRTGDTGQTGSLGQARLPKDDIRMEAGGNVDELNALLGYCLAAGVGAEIESTLTRASHDLFRLGAAISAAGSDTAPSVAGITGEDIAHLEAGIDALCDALPPIRDFVLPGGDAGAALLHLARTVCRRAERSLVRLAREAGLDGLWLAYVNRLSDYLFAAARAQNQATGTPETLWKKQTPGSTP